MNSDAFSLSEVCDSYLWAWLPETGE